MGTSPANGAARASITAFAVGMFGCVDLHTIHTVRCGVCFTVIEVVTHLPMPVQQSRHRAEDLPGGQCSLWLPDHSCCQLWGAMQLALL